MEFRKESYHESIDEICKFLDDHGEEVENMPVMPFLEIYKDAYEKRMLKIYTARVDGEMVGYAAFWVQFHPHHRGKVFANNDLVYIHPDHRGPEVINFFKFIEDELKHCDAITYNFKVEHDHPELMEHLGMTHTEKVYTKVLK